MVFLCMYCNSQNPLTTSVIEFEYHATGAYATAFFICPDRRNKFVVKIQDLGKLEIDEVDVNSNEQVSHHKDFLINRNSTARMNRSELNYCYSGILFYHLANSS